MFGLKLHTFWVFACLSLFAGSACSSISDAALENSESAWFGCNECKCAVYDLTNESKNQGCPFPKHAVDAFNRLKSLGKYVSEPKDFPGGSGAFYTAQRPGYAVLSVDLMDLPEGFFGYSNGVRDPTFRLEQMTSQQAQALRDNYKKRGKNAKQLKVIETRPPIYLASEDHSGSRKLTNVGFLDNKVVLVTRNYDYENPDALTNHYTDDEVPSIQWGSDTGIGPRFYGTTKCNAETQRRGIIMDIVRGDFPVTPRVAERMTTQAMQELVEIKKRLDKMWIMTSADEQYFSDGKHTTMIDLWNWYLHMGKDHETIVYPDRTNKIKPYDDTYLISNSVIFFSDMMKAARRRNLQIPFAQIISDQYHPRGAEVARALLKQ